MKRFAFLFPEELYHSYIIESDEESVAADLRNFLEDRGEVLPQSPDVFLNTYDAFTIADSMLVKEWHSSHPMASDKKICIIAARFINHEAQQSLLKILEEPHERTHFFLIVPQAGLLLETIRSRTHTIHIDNNVQVGPGQRNPSRSDLDVQKFLGLSATERLSVVGTIIEKYKDSVGSGALRHEATMLVNAFEQHVYERFEKNYMDSDTQFLLEELARARDYLSTPGASVKMILEHIALVI